MHTQGEQEIAAIVAKLTTNRRLFGTRFPHLDREGRYERGMNEDGSWTGSFWTGMLTIAYRITGNPALLDDLYRYLPVYRERLRSGYTDHDLGFLYQLYAVALYRTTGDAAFRELAVQAAERLLARYNPHGKFIRAWGRLEDNDLRGKIIIDCMMNLPLLYNVSAITGEPKYREAAAAHADNSRRHLLRADATAFHTFDFDPDIGAPLGGRWHDGYAEQSVWSRGQAWGIYGFALSYAHTGDPAFLQAAERMAAYFIGHLPADRVPMWDFRLPDGAPRLKDTSAAAIAACGLFELAQASGTTTAAAAACDAAARELLAALREYSAATDETRSGVLACSYGRLNGEPSHLYSIWGDYFYFEALCRATGRDWRMWL
ncbi:glycoside hydrolase family 88 protein [Paenibacillus cymbidii]|uniref:glycoside hydrolase family 88 protein n=1 Tax=Paenibacillus cymbidii TaxID=1639034 RepID=UPI001436BD90|nr:glycoside hydrolase family 88 protein [Paenibacillus cymbidii]